MLALVVLLVAAYTGGETAGSIAGSPPGIAVGMMGGSYGYLMGAYCLSGLVAGLFSPTGRLGTAASVTIVCAIATAVSQGGSPSAPWWKPQLLRWYLYCSPPGGWPG